ncbi:SGNH/GDSL hydrolase family protein [Thalassobacillus pellis]|uniref:SGNH/GDSL hydrolase family protein n=1 Tax=Thalassobacillus pellis TaxID=748008 RepID=UPI00196221C6|nr:SGNH/GDSL hydrolase family protein [Thalassobacillus pellis]MBM7551936.1 lysophospholipase L1-like esterase [Thalassobacillus pellis]
MNNKLSIIIISAVIILTGFFIITISLNDTSNNNDKEQPPQEQAVENKEAEQKKQEEQKEKSQPEKDESADNGDASIGQGIKKAVTSVLESAVDLFIKKDLKIVAIGDSLTQGVGDESEQGGYVGILENTLTDDETNPDFNIENYGKRGNRTDQLIERMKGKEMSESIEEADIIMITIGANDVMAVVKDNFHDLDYGDFVAVHEEYKQRLNEIFQIIYDKNPDVHTYLIGLFNPFAGYFNYIPEMGQIMDDWNQIGRNTVAKYDNATFIPINDLFLTTEEDLLWEDHFHPNQKGYKLIAERVLEYIRPEIEQQQ